MAAGVREAIRLLATLGARVTELRVPDPEILSDVCNVIARCESAAVHTRLVRERPEEIQPVVRARLELGFRIPATTISRPCGCARVSADRSSVRCSRRPTSSWRRSSPEPAPPLAHATEGDASEIAERQGRFSRLTRPFNGSGSRPSRCPAASRARVSPWPFRSSGAPSTRRPCFAPGTHEQSAGWHRRRPAVRLSERPLMREMFMRCFGTVKLAYLPVLITYFCYGASAVTTIALLFFQKDTLGITPADAAAIAFWVALPWSMKMVAGVASDSYPIFGSRRKAYLLLGALASLAGYALSPPWSRDGAATSPPWCW